MESRSGWENCGAQSEPMGKVRAAHPTSLPKSESHQERAAPSRSRSPSAGGWGFPNGHPGIIILFSAGLILTRKGARGYKHIPIGCVIKKRVKMKSMKTAFWIVTLITLYGCGMLPFRKSPPPPAKGDWMIKWLNNPTCLPPCWENITPGETNIDESIALLQQVEEIDSQKIVRIGSNAGPRNRVEVNWGFKDSNYGGLVNTIRDDPIIKMIHLDSDQVVTIAEIVSKYGDPQEVLVSRCMSGFCEVFLIYKEMGMGLYIFPRQLRSRNSLVELFPVQVVDSVQFYSKVPDATDSYDLGIYTWKGYTTYP